MRFILSLPMSQVLELYGIYLLLAFVGGILAHMAWYLVVYKLLTNPKRRKAEQEEADRLRRQELEAMLFEAVEQLEKKDRKLERRDEALRGLIATLRPILARAKRALVHEEPGEKSA